MSETHDERTRIAVAQLAARFMAEDGETDTARARRKAAHALGARKAKKLPGNREIEAALRRHQALFMADTHPGDLLYLKRMARHWMREFADFSPRLTGALAKGIANFSSSIEIDLVVDDIKFFDFFLLNRNLVFQIVSVSQHSTRSIYRLKNQTPWVDILVNTAASSHPRSVRQGSSDESLSLAELEKQLATQPEGFRVC